jgi:hypothetical protein
MTQSAFQPREGGKIGGWAPAGTGECPGTDGENREESDVPDALARFSSIEEETGPLKSV